MIPLTELEILGFGGLLVAAIAIGAVASMVGIGGGIFLVPLLAFFYVGTTQEAVGTSLAAVVFNSLSSTVSYTRQRMVDFKLGLALMPTAALGGWLGAVATRYISSGALAVAFGVLLIYVAALMLLGKAPKDLAQRLRRGAGDGGGWLFRALVGFLAGVAAGFFGIGGGIVMVPAMALLLGTDIVVAVATSLFVMGPSALIAAIQHFLQGNLNLLLALPLALGVLIGAQLGSWATTRVPQIRLRQLFGLVLLYSAVNMIWKGLSQLLS